MVPLRLDVTNRDEVAQISKKASDVQVLVNNAGFAESSGICFGYNEEAARQELEVNFFGPLHLIRAFAQTLIEKKGAIANVISIAGLFPFPMAATYSVSKAAAHSLTQGVMAELAHLGVSVFGIYPGPIDTDMADGLPYEKETPAQAAIRIFDAMKQGIEDITPDAFADQFVSDLKSDIKAVEKNTADLVVQMRGEQ